nr:DEAD/DEAH box helicase [Bacilli bacterium]
MSVSTQDVLLMQLQSSGITVADSGDILKNGGARDARDKFDRPTVKSNSLILHSVTGNQITLVSNFGDKDYLKEHLNAQFDGETKRWVIGINYFKKAIRLFKHVTVKASVRATKEQQLAKIEQQAADEAAERARLVWDGVLPQDMQAKHVVLYAYQNAGVNFLLKYKTTVLGFAVGLGKTPTAIAAANVLLDQKEVSRVLIIAPNSVKFQWASEIAKFSGRTAVVLDNSTPVRLKKAFEAAQIADYVILHYEMLRSAKYKTQITALAVNAVVIADEAHKVKNYKAQQTQAFQTLTNDRKYMWLLTATPFPNAQPQETYTMLSHVHPIGSWLDFGRKYVVFERGYRGARVPVRLRNHKSLRNEMQDTVILRQHNSPDVQISLPSTRYVTQELSMSAEQCKIYDAMASDLMHKLDAMDSTTYRQNAANVLAQMKRLEQIANDVDLLEDEATVDMDRLSVKEEWAVNVISDHLEDAENRGIVVFAESKLVLRKINKALINQGLDASQIGTISGEVAPEKRTKIVSDFGTGAIRVVLSTSAGEEGINLQTGGHTMIHMDQPWVPKSITQREGRILRSGQPSEFTLFYSPLMAGTVEFYKRSKIMFKVGEIEKLLGQGAAGSVAENINETGAAWTLDELKDMLRR